MPPQFEFRGNRQGGRPRQQPEFTFRSRFPKTSARPLLSMSQRETTPELLCCPQTAEQKARKFMSLEDLTDSDEAEMEVSSADEGSQPPRKKQVTESSAGPVANAPRWSNPDPYTVLLPSDENPVKRKDFVKLIRKARIQSTPQPKPDEHNAVVLNDDFISFGMDDMEMDETPENAPRGPKSSMNQDGDPALGSRKRTHDDEIIGQSRRPGAVGKFFNSDGSILLKWKPFEDQNTTPWIDSLGPSIVHLGSRLHNEILSFYHWVKPKPFENSIRNDLIARLQRHFERRHYGSQLRAFGSFASGLYLPTADMDLVLLSRQFIRQDRKVLCQRPREIYSFAAYLKDLDIAVPGSVETIAHAKVPIIKFVDRLTGLKVDLSFDNSTGIAANETFQVWKSQFPAMPIIVSVIKQFLLLRGLNEVPTGGLGGFSIICLVTSLLQHLPYSGAEPNLGGVLMDFFDFYGNKFDSRRVGIQFDPPGYFDKKLLGVYQANKQQRLAIMDPNNPDNDISGGTKEIPLIFRAFADAYQILKQDMVQAAFFPQKRMNSLLGSIIGANYESYDRQRTHLTSLCETDPRFAHFFQPPPPNSPPPEAPATPPPPPPEEPGTVAARGTEHNNSAQNSKLSKKQSTALDRANRLRKLRPDLKKVPKFVALDAAVKLGGYSSIVEMDSDLSRRGKAPFQQ
ncbi:DNA polymerase sigma subunit [Blastomyces dermatitidis ER-3]|uniref:polynucleotide adenylyltransferase n=1 Tax=Ajellomyces dermatitidis (strain ER-3 / ATCC MYA-2586) TaxID=559297 RepID=A0ABP2F520_AJEDR|nr:DNA polymerase sigma subunit [Blastomyces dermatitidis ER-3]EEQ92121.1 DNA polymerase sigma subunit [Blastomyces dermatitidis ER-3]